MSNNRRGSRLGNKEQEKILRASPKASGVSDYRKASLQEEIENNDVKLGRSYNGSVLNKNEDNVLNNSNSNSNLPKINRGTWLLADDTVSLGNRRNSDNNISKALCTVAHSPSYTRQKEEETIKKIATVGTVGGSGGSALGVERLAPEVYSPLFTMANLNLPRDRLTVNAWCFLPDTLVWMADGVRKKIKDLKIGDNIISGNGEVRKIINVFKREVNEEIVGIKIKGDQEIIWSTKNHKFNAIKADKVKCKNCEKDKYRKCKPNENNFCSRCNRKEDPYFFDKIQAGDLEINDSVFLPVLNTSILPEDKLLHNEEILELLGYYTAEGYISNNELGFVFNKFENYQANKIVSIIKKYFNYEARVIKNTSTIKIRCYNKKLCDFFYTYCGKGSLNKKISKDIVNLPPNFLIAFLKAWMDGDGNQNKIYRRFNGRTSSTYLASQLKVIALKCNLIVKIFKSHYHKNMKSLINDNIYKVQPTNLILITGNSASKFVDNYDNNYRFKKFNDIKRYGDGCSFIYSNKLIQYISDIKIKNYKGFVYNIEVEKDHTYVVGSGVSVQNCRVFFQLHPIVRNAITLHSTYPISKLNLKCHDRKVLQFHEDMIEEMGLMESVGDLALEYWKLGEKIQGSSLITMADGSLKPISEIQIGDVVLTHLGNKKRVIEKFVKPTNNVIEEHLKIYKIYAVGLSEPLIISGKHPVLLTKHSEIECETKACKNKKIRVLPDKIKCGNCRKLNIDGQNLSPQFIETNNINVGDIIYSPFNKDEITNPDFNDDICYIMGYWLAEGCYCKNSESGKYTGIKFCSYDKSYIDNELIPLLNKCFNYSGKTYVSKSSYFSVGKDKYDHLLMSDKRNGPNIANFFIKHCGEYSKNKKMSDVVMSLPINQQLQILAGFIDGDGCVDKSNGHIIISTSSKSLANQIAIILRRANCHPTISSVEPILEKNIAKKYRVKIVANESYEIFKSLLKSEKKNCLIKTKWCSPNSSIYKNWQILSIKKIENITNNFNEDYMYDIEVEDDHSYIANGIAIHNCFPYSELNENNGKWSKITILNPDYILVKKTILSGDPIISLRPDAVLQRLVFSNNPADIQLRKQIPEKVVYHVRNGQAIPLDNFNVSHLKMLASPYDVHGTSIIVGVFKELMLWDKLRECYSEDTEFLTENGFKKYNEINNGEKLATFNKENKKIQYQNFINRTQYHYNGDMYYFNGEKIDILVTPNHRMWVAQSKSNGNGYNDFEFKKAEDLGNEYFYKTRCVADWDGKDINFINIIGKEISIKDYLKFLGYLISEGCIQHNELNYNYLISVNQSYNSKYLLDINKTFIKISNILGIYCEINGKINNKGIYSNKSEEAISLKITNKELLKYFSEEIGINVENRKIPYWIKQLNKKYLKILLLSLVRGNSCTFTPNDARKKSNCFEYTTISKQLADDIQEIIFKCGYSPIVVKKWNEQKTCNYYLISWSESNFEKFPLFCGNKKDKLNGDEGIFKKIPYDGMVSCFEVPNELLVTRRNGLISIQGNSKFAQADSLINPITIIKVGGTGEGEYKATQEDLEYYKNIFEEAEYDKSFKLITHAGITVERAGAAGSVIEIQGDMDMITKNIYTGLMVPPAIVDSEGAAYASASIGLEVLRQRYFNFRNIIARWLKEKIFAPISEVQNFYEYKDGKKRLIVPEIEWNYMNLYDMQDYISSISSLVGSKQASVQTLYRSLGLNYEDERIKIRQEMIHDAIKRREEMALGTMTLSELRALDPEKEILEPIVESISGGETEGMQNVGAGGGGEMGIPGGLPELAPPPGSALSAPGAGAPEVPGGIPPLGPGTLTGPKI